MSTTLLNYRDAIKLDYGLEGDANFGTTRLNWLINLAQRFVQLELMGLGMKKWEAVAVSVSLSAGSFGGQSVKTTPVPSTMIESPNSIRFAETGVSSISSVAFELPEKAAYEKLKNSFSSPSLNDPIFWRMNNLIYLAPNTITIANIHYASVVTDLVADADVSGIPVEFAESVIKRVGIEVDFIKKKIQDKQAAIDELSKSVSDQYQKWIAKTQVEDRDKKIALQ